MENEQIINDQERKSVAPEQILKFLMTEHVALQTARATIVSDANGRINVFLSVVASSVIALAFIGQISNVGTAFYMFALVLFPSLFFLGLVTLLRALQNAMEDSIHVRGINRIRHYYAEIAPEMRDYFVHSIHDESSSVLQDMAIGRTVLQPFVTTAGTIIVINSILAAIWISLLAQYLFAPPVWLTAVFGGFLFIVALASQQIYQTRRWEDFEAHLTVKSLVQPSS